MNRERIEAWIAQTHEPHSRPPAIAPGSKLPIDDIMDASSPPHSDVHVIDDLQRTPTNNSPSKRRRLDALGSLSLRQRTVTEDTPSLHDTSSVTRSTTGGSKSRGSRSPVKSVSDLRLTEKPVNISRLRKPDTVPSDVAQFFGYVQRVRAGRDIMPLSVKKDIQSVLTVLDDPLSEASFYDAQQWSISQGLRPWDEGRELELFMEVVDATQECEDEEFAEPAWNTRVHHPLLEFVLKSFAGQVRHYDVTRAPINKPYLPRHKTGVDSQAKMVDFCIALAGDDIMSAAQRRQETANDSSSINHTSYKPIRDRPIAVNIETKAPASSNEEAKAQLSVWTIAHLKRLRSLACTSNSTLAVDVTIPVISVCGGKWELYFVRDQVDGMNLIPTFSIGSTDTLVGCYKIAAFLRHLGIWIQTVYREWLLKNALAVEKIGDVGNTIFDV